MAGRATPSVRGALDRALRSCETEDQDAATVALAKNYASMIDAEPGCLWRIGPRLLEVLAELRMTPRSRAAVVKGGAGGDGERGGDGPDPDPLGDLQRRADSRKYDPTSVDTAAS